MAGIKQATGLRRTPARWISPHPDPSAVEQLQRELGVHALAARVLVRRGMGDSEAARRFLDPDLTSLHDPHLMADMGRAADRLHRAIKTSERILLYGDYDVDGTTSIVILKKAIELLGGAADFHIPHRLKDGYGMHADVIDAASRNGVRLIVSVDTGIRASAVVEQARGLGIDVIVTDHHLPESTLPPALAVLNPNRRDCPYPEKNLCGAGVALKLIQALLLKSDLTPDRQRLLLDSFLKLVAVATVADIVPLTGENRTIVRRGLSGFGTIRNAGLRALLEVAGFARGDLPSANQVAFRLAPRINAAGRMASATDVIELFVTTDEKRARELAQQLDRLNRERQDEEAATVEQILAECDAVPVDDGQRALIFAQPGWHLGVVGIVASRLVERFSRPVFVLTTSRDEGYLSGSGRSIPAFHLLEALESMPDLFTKFGGHRQAAGLTIPADKVSSFRQRFTDFANQKLSPGDLCPQHTIDATTDFTELTDASVDEVFALAPFGFGNATPLFHATDVEVAGPPRLLSDGKHCKVPMRQGNRMLVCNGWNFGDRADLFQPGRRLEVLFQIEEDSYARSRGLGNWSITLKDVRTLS
ncbi:MAG: single-stranded-DNA-specific exonuclease RecJ [Bryobacteraceae bacterium]